MGYIPEAPPERDKVVPLAPAPYLSRELLDTQARRTLHRSPTYLGLQVGHLQVQLIQVLVHKCDERLSKQRSKGPISNLLQNSSSPQHGGLRPCRPFSGG